MSLHFLACDLSVPAILLGYGARGYRPTMFGEIVRRRFAVRGGIASSQTRGRERVTRRRVGRIASCNRLPPLDQLIRKFGDLAFVEFAVVGLKCTACGHRGAGALS